MGGMVVSWMPSRPRCALIHFRPSSDRCDVLFPFRLFFVRRQREELFAALDEVTENHMTLKDQLDEARAIHRERAMEREEAEAECKEVSYLFLTMTPLASREPDDRGCA